MTFPETVISVPIWDSEEQSQWTLALIEAANNESIMRGDFHLVLVDNASPSQATQQALLQAETAGIKRLSILRNETNLGYGRAANRGIFYGLGLGAEYGIVMNNDITIQNPDWVEEAFVSHLRVDPNQLMGSRLIDFNGGAIYDGHNVTPYLEGWCMAFHRSFVENVGLFDGAIFNWHEDAELCIRAVKNGFKLAQSPAFEWNGIQPMVKGPLVHASGKTGFKKLDYTSIAQASRDHVVRKHFGK
jgi:GT2 family glycosyltransferase